MNILKPELLWVGNRCYRLPGNSERTNPHNMSTYIEDDYQDDPMDCEDEYVNSDIEVVPYEGTKFKHTFHVAKSFFPFIIGTKNTSRKRLEAETRTVIQVPSIGQDGDVVITGHDRKGIVTARRRINLLIAASRKRLTYTHFLSIPLNEGHVIMKFNMFKNDVLTNSGKTSKGVDETIFQIPSKLHLTIGVLTLLDDAEINQAIEALNYCKEHVVKPIIKKYGQIHIHMQGTEIMNDDPTEAKVLYARISNTDEALQEIVNSIANYYADIGLIRKETDKVKLHVTLMNTSFKLRNEELNNKIRGPFDATEIMKAHENTFFGEVPVKQIHLSQRHTISNNGYYQATGKISLYEDM